MRRNQKLTLAVLGALLLVFAIYRLGSSLVDWNKEQHGDQADIEFRLNEVLASHTAPGREVTIKSCQMVEVIVPGRGCLIPSGTRKLTNRVDLRAVGSVEYRPYPADNDIHLWFLPHRRFGLRSLSEPLAVSETRLRCNGAVFSEVQPTFHHTVVLSDSAPIEVREELMKYIKQSCH